MSECESCDELRAELDEARDRLNDTENERDDYKLRYERLSEAVAEIACPVSDALSYLQKADNAADKARGI